MISDLHRVGGGFSVRFSIAPAASGEVSELACEWHPRLPSPREFRRKVSLDQYRAARDLFLAALAERYYGGKALCIELPGNLKGAGV